MKAARIVQAASLTPRSLFLGLEDRRQELKEGGP